MTVRFFSSARRVVTQRVTRHCRCGRAFAVKSERSRKVYCTAKCSQRARRERQL